MAAQRNLNNNVIMITAQHLCKRVASPEGPLTILDNISFTVDRAATLAIVGVSGSGKSTLLGLLAGLDTPSAGRTILDGMDLGALDEDARAQFRRNRVGFVFQSFHLLPSLTALENVMLPLELDGHAAPRARALHELQRVGLGSRLGHYPNQLSGGEQQRVAIARAFAPEPQVLFADEPTGNLDRRTGQVVADLLFSSRDDRGTTLILVTHDERLAARCSRQLVLESGSLLSDSLVGEP